MQLDFLLNKIAESCQSLISELETGEMTPALGLRRSARPPVIATLYKKLQRPLLILTDHTDRALTIADEISIWDKSIPIYQFPEPTPLFYENAAASLEDVCIQDSKAFRTERFGLFQSFYHIKPII